MLVRPNRLSSGCSAAALAELLAGCRDDVAVLG
jgi:hypothetical protein